MKMIKRNVLLRRNFLVLACLATAGFATAAGAAKTARPGGGSALLPRALPDSQADSQAVTEKYGVQCQGASCATQGGAALFNEEPQAVGAPSVAPSATGFFGSGGINSVSSQAVSSQEGSKGLAAKTKQLLRRIPSVAAQAAAFFSGESGKSAAEASQALANAVQESASWDAETRGVLSRFINIATLGSGGLPEAIEEAKGISDPQEQEAWLENMLNQCSVPVGAAAL